MFYSSIPDSYDINIEIELENWFFKKYKLNRP